jgi:hypothetical protein
MGARVMWTDHKNRVGLNQVVIVLVKGIIAYALPSFDAFAAYPAGFHLISIRGRIVTCASHSACANSWINSQIRVEALFSQADSTLEAEIQMICIIESFLSTGTAYVAKREYH